MQIETLRYQYYIRHQIQLKANSLDHKHTVSMLGVEEMSKGYLN